MTKNRILKYEVHDTVSYLNWTIRVSTAKLSPVVDESSYSSTAFATHLQNLCVNTRYMLLLPSQQNGQDSKWIFVTGGWNWM